MHYLLIKKQNESNFYSCDEVWSKDEIVDHIINKGDSVVDYDIYEISETISNCSLEKEFNLKTIQKEILKLEKSVSEFSSDIKQLELDIENRKKKNGLELLELIKLKDVEKKLK